MHPSDAGARQPAVARQEDLSASARGWHTIQMAVLGFIGICGVLRTTGSSPAPRAVEWLAAALAVAALVVACLAVSLSGGLLTRSPPPPVTPVPRRMPRAPPPGYALESGSPSWR